MNTGDDTPSNAMMGNAQKLITLVVMPAPSITLISGPDEIRVHVPLAERSNISTSNKKPCNISHVIEVASAIIDGDRLASMTHQTW